MDRGSRVLSDGLVADSDAAARTSPPPAVQAPVVPRPRVSLMRRALPLVGLLLLAGVSYYGWHWWTVGRFEETTDDAFLQADKVVVAPRIAGVVSSVLVADNQAVRAGDVLARIDDRDYQVALSMAVADQAKAEAGLLGAAAALVQQGAQVQVSEAGVVDAQAALGFSAQEATRYHNLAQTGSGSLQRQQQTDMDLHQKLA
ncbi:MAG: HlyD family secretion protein, partial [Janthinobacterium lividum]